VVNDQRGSARLDTRFSRSASCNFVVRPTAGSARHPPPKKEPSGRLTCTSCYERGASLAFRTTVKVVETPKFQRRRQADSLLRLSPESKGPARYKHPMPEWRMLFYAGAIYE